MFTSLLQDTPIPRRDTLGIFDAVDDRNAQTTDDFSLLQGIIPIKPAYISQLPPLGKPRKSKFTIPQRSKGSESRTSKLSTSPAGVSAMPASPSKVTDFISGYVPQEQSVEVSVVKQLTALHTTTSSNHYPKPDVASVQPASQPQLGSGTTTIRATDEHVDLPLPAGWIKHFSQRENREYWFNSVTGKSVWIRPTE